MGLMLGTALVVLATTDGQELGCSVALVDGTSVMTVDGSEVGFRVGSAIGLKVIVGTLVLG